MKYFLYARKSTDDEGHQLRSIDAQLAELRQFAKKEKLLVIRELTEAQTAKEPGRPVFNSMMDAIEQGQASGIIAWHPDRLARNSVDGGRVIYAIDTGKLETLKFPTFWFEGTPQGKFMLQISFGQSKYYVDNLSENVRRGIREKLRRNEFPGWAPVGYLNEPRRKTIIFDEDKAPIIKRMFTTFAKGNTGIAELHRKATDWGLTGHSGKSVALSKIPVLLANPFYIGMFLYKGETYEGKHKPLVSQELFDQVQGVLSRRKRGRYKPKKELPFRNFMTCLECTCAITGERQKDHNYYRCTKRKGPCSLGYIREELLVDYLRQSIDRVALPEEISELMISEAERERQSELSDVSEAIEICRSDLSELQDKLSRLLDAYLEGIIPKKEYVLRKQQFVQQQIRLKDRIKKLKRGKSTKFEPMIEFLYQTKEAKRTVFSNNLYDLRDFHRRIGSNLYFSSPASQENFRRSRESDQNNSSIEFQKMILFGGKAAEARARKVSKDSVSLSPHSHVTPCVTKNIFSSFSGQSTKRPVPVLLVQYPMPWKIFSDSRFFSNWRRGRDSNPRYAYTYNRFRVCRLRPLSHPSAE